jgi:hypothetical protein
MSGELLLMTKLNVRSSAVSVFCCSGKLLKQMAVKSVVVKGTFGGYRISTSGPEVKSISASTRARESWPTNVYIEVTDNTILVSLARVIQLRASLQSDCPAREVVVGGRGHRRSILLPRAPVRVQDLALELFHLASYRVTLRLWAC